MAALFPDTPNAVSNTLKIAEMCNFEFDFGNIKLPYFDLGNKPHDEELKDMDRRTWRKFRADYSVDELDIRFELEREFEAQGKSIRNREFFTELKKRLS